MEEHSKEKRGITLRLGYTGEQQCIVRKHNNHRGGEMICLDRLTSRLVGRSQGLGVLGLVGFSRPSFPLLANFEMSLQDVASRESLAAGVADPVLDIKMRL